jgi:hypothetical protein
MNNDILSLFALGLCCLGFLALAVLVYASSFKRFRKFSTAVQGKLSGWDAFNARTGLQWEAKTPAYSPVEGRLFGSETAAKTGRVVGTYRGYPVILSNITRDHYSGPRGGARMVSRQTYYTLFLLTIKNPAAIQLEIRKDKQVTFEPQDVGARLLKRMLSFGRLAQIPNSFAINVQQQELRYVQPEIEQDANKLLNVLEILCDLADSADSY